MPELPTASETFDIEAIAENPPEPVSAPAITQGPDARRLSAADFTGRNLTEANKSNGPSY